MQDLARFCNSKLFASQGLASAKSWSFKRFRNGQFADDDMIERQVLHISCTNLLKISPKSMETHWRAQFTLNNDTRDLVFMSFFWILSSWNKQAIPTRVTWSDRVSFTSFWIAKEYGLPGAGNHSILVACTTLKISWNAQWQKQFSSSYRALPLRNLGLQNFSSIIYRVRHAAKVRRMKHLRLKCITHLGVDVIVPAWAGVHLQKTTSIYTYKHTYIHTYI